MAHAHLEIGIASPFLYTPRPHTLPSLDRLRATLREIGGKIASEGTPRPLGPFVIGLTGNGNVAQGCLSMLSELPIQHVSVNDLDVLVRDPDTSLHKIYLVHAKPEDYFVRSDGQGYDRESYYDSPELYHSVFCDKVAPYLTLFLNGIGWSNGYPRLMNDEQLVTALKRARELGGARFTNIGDISCDVSGGLEFMTKATTLSSPTFKIKPRDPSLPEVQVMSVDILPTSIPLDASRQFSSALMPYLNRAIDWYSGKDQVDDHLHKALERATTAVGGELTAAHQWLQQGVDTWRAAQTAATHSHTSKATGALKKKKVLLLGSGMVAGPAVDQIGQRNDIELVVASNMLAELQMLTRKYDNATYKVIDMTEESGLASLVAEADVVISLLPVALHTRAAELCIRHGKHLVTASYISPTMRALHESATQAGVVLLNEIGLDPGIDHCSTHAMLRQFRRDKKRVVSFTSFCGGFPAPESVGGVPLSYKFSWTPRGVLGAALNGARFKLGGKVRDVEGEDLLKSTFPDVPVLSKEEGGGIIKFEGLPNRDSLPYVDTYGLGKIDDLRTVLRGTLRYPGFSRLMYGFKQLGLLDMENKVEKPMEGWENLVSAALAKKVKDDAIVNMSAEEAIKMALIDDQDLSRDVINAAKWLGLVKGGNTATATQIPKTPAAPIDLFAALLGDRLKYEPGDRDMVVLSHEFVVATKAEEEVYKSTLVAYGETNEGGYTAMARTVGIPVAIAALRVLDGKVGPQQGVVGVVGPSEPSVYEAVLEGLETVGLGMKESKVMTRSVRTVERSLVEGN
ncbi:Saccharopine dehydrogenase domain containing protein [Amanita muscaria]